MLCWARRVVSVAPIIAKAKPEEMPRNRAARGAASKYGRIASGRGLRQSPSDREVIVERERRVVREAAALVDGFARGAGGDARRRDLVVDAPADVLGVGAAAVRPPGVLIRLLVQAPEHIDEADLVEHARQPLPLLRQAARALLVPAPVAAADLLLPDCPVPPPHNPPSPL